MALTTEEMERLAKVEGFEAIAHTLARLADHERVLDTIGQWAQKYADEAEDPEESKRFKNILQIIEHGA